MLPGGSLPRAAHFLLLTTFIGSAAHTPGNSPQCSSMHPGAKLTCLNQGAPERGQDSGDLLLCDQGLPWVSKCARIGHWHAENADPPISRAIASPWGYVMGASFLSLRRSIVSLSSLRSSLVPTRIMGVFGQWCRTSGYHCVAVRTEGEVQHNTAEVFYTAILYLDCITLWMLYV